MAQKVSIDKLSSCISSELKLYSNSIVSGMKKANDDCMSDFVNDTKRDAPRGHRKKKKFYTQITSKTTKDTPNIKVNVWYVKNPQYRLTHLIKNGHATRNGGRTKAQDFITNNYEKMSKKFENKITEVIKNGH